MVARPKLTLPIVLAIALIGLASGGAIAAVWVDAWEHKDINASHVQAYVGAWLDDSGGVCRFWLYQHDDGDSVANPPFDGYVQTDFHRTDNTLAWTIIDLTFEGQSTGNHVQAEIWTNPTPPCSV